MAVQITTLPTVRGIAHTGSLLDELLCYYSCNDGSGTVLTDVHNGNNGTLVNATFNATSKLGSYAIESDYFGDRVDFGSSTLFGNLYDKITFSFWLKINTFPVAPDYNYLIYLRRDATYPNIGCYINNDHRIYFFALSYIGSNEYTYSSVIVNTSTYFHVVCIANGIGNDLKIYIDGVDDTQRVYSQLGPFDPYWHTTHHILNNGGTRGINGLMDEIYMAGRAISYDEVLKLNNSGSGLEYPFT